MVAMQLVTLIPVEIIRDWARIKGHHARRNPIVQTGLAMGAALR